MYDAKTGEPVLFSPIFLKGTKFGVTTDINGFFSISKIPPGDYNLMIVNLLYDTIQEPITIVAGKILNRKFQLKESIKELKEVVVKSSRSREARENTVNASITRITPKEIRFVPPVGGEHDLAQYLQTVPGVVFSGDQGGQLYMRGGSNVQTLTLMDGMMIYNPFHSLGLFSVFDTDILKNVDVYTAAFPSEYGGRASAVIDVRTIDGNKNRIAGKVGVNPFTSKVILEGPLSKAVDGGGGGITFLASYRTSYLDKTSPKLYRYANQTGNYLPFSFGDAYGKVTFHGDKGNKASLFGFNYTDQAKLGQQGNFSWNSSGGGGSFLFIPNSPTMLITYNLGYSNYGVKIEEETVAPRTSNTANLNTNLDFTYHFNKDEFRFGFGGVSNATSYKTISPDLTQTTFEANNLETFAFLKYRYHSGFRLILEPNLRVQYYASLSLMRLEPRMGAKFALTDKIRLKAAAGLYSQNLVSTQSDRDVVALFNGFISSPPQVYAQNINIQDPSNRPIQSALQKATHFVAGFEYDLTDDLDITVEPYVKYFDDFVNVNRDRIFPEQPVFIVEKSTARGVDLITKYDRDPFYFTLGYSYAKVDRTFSGHTYYPIFDRRHNVNVVGSYTFGKAKEWEVDMRWNMGSGFPFTQTVAYYEDLNLNGNLNQNLPNQNGNLGIYYGGLKDFNKGRQPYYHRLDFSVKRVWKFTEKQKMEAVFSLINTYNRQNLFYFDRVAYKRINQLPILPAVGVNYTF